MIWPDRRLLDILGIELPIILAPMAGPGGSELAIAVAEAGGLGSLPCAMLSPEQVRSELTVIRRRTSRPINVNFFCHRTPEPDPAREAAWRKRLALYYQELGLAPDASAAGTQRMPFDDPMCAVVEEFAPEVVSFHFGLPEPRLIERVKTTGAKVLSSATTVAEARWLEERGCDAIIAQGFEAGGHRGMFLSDDIATQVGNFALIPQIVDAVRIPVIAAGGIGDARGIVAAAVLGAAAVQIGSIYMRCPESKATALHRSALATVRDDSTVLTNVVTGRPARGFLTRLVREVGPMSTEAPAFPLAAGAIGPLRAKAEAAGSGDFSTMWAGQAAGFAREISAGEITRRLAEEADELFRKLRGQSVASVAGAA